MTKEIDDHTAALELLTICEDNLGDVECAYAAAKKALAKRTDDMGLQLDGVEAAVLHNDHKQAVEWLTIIEQDPEADSMTKAVASFYRFWISYAEDNPSSKQDLQHLVASLNEYNRGRTVVSAESASWSFEGARRVLNKNTLPLAISLPEKKKKDLLAIIDAFEHPDQGTTALSRLAERM